VQALAAVPALRFTPGQQFEYSNSNYTLLAEIVHSVSGTALPQLLRERIFQPLDLNMLLNPDRPIPGKATSYRNDDGTGPQATDHHWVDVGAGDILTTAGELVRWADNYRTGNLGGRRLLQAQLANPVNASGGAWAHNLGRDFTYGAGIALATDGTLVHTGHSEGFATAFEVRPDRRTAIAVTCNSPDTGSTVLAAELRKIWT
jgi:CubicO group peptidase (beta-lactamase class C family)